ncbi:hypothetical protein HDU97_009360 [Phlyctochytrium planicorne]|nr:hypothetical protein HDU97_009360 [Phlyctochytrium planicorne]
MKDLLLVLEGTTGPAGTAPLTLFYSNNPDINLLFEDNVRAVPIIKTTELDFNRDGLQDQLQFNITMPLLPNDSILRVRLALILRYELTSRFRFKMQTLALLDESTGIPSQSLQVDGDLRIFQRNLLNTDEDSVQFDAPIVDLFGSGIGSSQGWAPLDETFGRSALGRWERGRRGMGQAWSQIVASFLERNVRTTFAFTSPIWQSPRGQSEPFTLTGRVRFPEDKFLYRPGSLEVIKFGYIQFLAHFVLVASVCRWIFVWAIKSQIVATHVAVDVLPRYQPGRNGFKVYPF